MPPATKVDDAPRCGGGIKTREIAKSALAVALDNKELIDKLRNRLPVWATALISLLTFALGFTLSFAVFALRAAQAAG